MAVQPSTNAYLSRTANPFVNATGWGFGFWVRRTGSVTASEVETLWEIEDVGDGDFVKLYVNDAHNCEFIGVNDFDQVTLFAMALNTWYYLALVSTSSTLGNVYWRTEGATSFSSSTGRKIQTDNGWDEMFFMNNANSLETASHFEFFAFKNYIGTISEAQLWNESQVVQPKVATSALDSFLPLYTASGTDESGRARDWTVNGTVNEVKSQPRISRGGGGRHLVLLPSAASAVTMGGPLAVAEAIPSPAAASMQPVTMGGAVALAAAALGPAITYPVTLGGPLPVAAAVQSPAALSVQPVTLGAPVAASAVVQQPALGSLALPSVTSAAVTPQQPATTSTQPVTLAAAMQLALSIQSPAVSTSGITVASPAPIVLAAPSPSVDDPYPHSFARRTRGDFRRAKLG